MGPLAGQGCQTELCDDNVVYGVLVYAFLCYERLFNKSENRTDDLTPAYRYKLTEKTQCFLVWLFCKKRSLIRTVGNLNTWSKNKHFWQLLNPNEHNKGNVYNYVFVGDVRNKANV